MTLRTVLVRRFRRFVPAASASLVALAPLPLEAATSAAPQASAAAPPPRQWVVDESGLTCAMARPLDGDPAATLVVRTYAGSGEYDATIVRSEWPGSARSFDQRVTLTLLPGGVSYERPGGVEPLPGGQGTGLRFGALPADFLGAFAKATGLSLTAARKTFGTYTFPLAAAVARAFEQCEAAKLTEWGADPAGFGPGATRARPIGGHDWVMPKDTPGNPPKISARFFALARLAVGADGRPQKCDLLQSSGSKPLEGRVCSLLMERARYEPARDKTGKPIPSVAVHRAEWVLVVRDEMFPAMR